MIDAPAAARPVNKVLTATAFNHTADYAAPRFHVVVDNDVTLEDILRPAFWAHHTGKLKRFNQVDILRENGTLDVTVRILDIGQGFIKVRALRTWEDESVAKSMTAETAAAPTAETLPDEYKITFGKGNFVLTYLPNDTRLGSFKTRDLAVTACKEHAANAGIAWPDTEPATDKAA